MTWRFTALLPERKEYAGHAADLTWRERPKLNIVLSRASMARDDQQISVNCLTAFLPNTRAGRGGGAHLGPEAQAVLPRVSLLSALCLRGFVVHHHHTTASPSTRYTFRCAFGFCQCCKCHREQQQQQLAHLLLERGRRIGLLSTLCLHHHYGCCAWAGWLNGSLCSPTTKERKQEV